MKIDVIRKTNKRYQIESIQNYQINLKFCKCVSGSWLFTRALKNKLVLLQTYQIPRNREPSIRMEFKKEEKDCGFIVFKPRTHLHRTIILQA